MNFNKRTIYGLLLTFNLARNTRTNIFTAAQELNLSRSFLEQVAGMLRKAGVINSIRGPGGGFELNGDPTINDVLLATDGALDFVEESLTSQDQQYVNLIGLILRQCVSGVITTSVRSFIADDETISPVVNADDQRTV